MECVQPPLKANQQKRGRSHEGDSIQSLAVAKLNREVQAAQLRDKNADT